MQPLVLSPNVWMCMPRLALASWPLRSQETVVGPPSDSCTKVTVPETLESPRTTATRRCAHISHCSTASGPSSNRRYARHLQGSDAQKPSDQGTQGPRDPVGSQTDEMLIKVAAEADRVVLNPSIPDASRSVGFVCSWAGSIQDAC